MISGNDPRHTLILLAYLRQRQVAAELALIESFAPAPPPVDPVTDEEKAALRRVRDAALARIEQARGRLR